MFKQRRMNNLNILRQLDEEGLNRQTQVFLKKQHLVFKEKQVSDVPLLLGADKG